MSAPQTNIETQEKSHRFPLWGIAAAVGVGVLLLLTVLTTAFDDDDLAEPGPTVTQEEVAN